MKRTILLLIRLYQILSLNVLFRIIFIGGCRFTPTCSEYTYQAIAKYGTIKGLKMGVKRLFRCHPFSKGGPDPVC